MGPAGEGRSGGRMGGEVFGKDYDVLVDQSPRSSWRKGICAAPGCRPDGAGARCGGEGRLRGPCFVSWLLRYWQADTGLYPPPAYKVHASRWTLSPRRAAKALHAARDTLAAAQPRVPPRQTGSLATCSLGLALVSWPLRVLRPPTTQRALVPPRCGLRLQRRSLLRAHLVRASWPAGGEG